MSKYTLWIFENVGDCSVIYIKMSVSLCHSYTTYPIKQDRQFSETDFWNQSLNFYKDYDCALCSFSAYPKYHKCLFFTIQIVHLNHTGHCMSLQITFRAITTSMLMLLMLHSAHENNSSLLKVFGKFSKSKYKATISCLDKNNAQCHHWDSEQKHWNEQTNKIQSAYFVHLRR